MPTSRETVANRALNGHELRDIIRRQFDRLLEADGMLTPGVAYGRVAFKVQLTLHMDQLMMQPVPSFVHSAPADKVSVEGKPALAALEAFPLRRPGPDAEVGSLQLTYEIDSPNQERLRHDLPITLESRGQDGQVTQHPVHYPAPEGLGDGQVAIEDVTQDAVRRMETEGGAAAVRTQQPRPSMAEQLAKLKADGEGQQPPAEATSAEAEP